MYERTQRGDACLSFHKRRQVMGIRPASQRWLPATRKSQTSSLSSRLRDRSDSTKRSNPQKRGPGGTQNLIRRARIISRRKHARRVWPLSTLQSSSFLVNVKFPTDILAGKFPLIFWRENSIRKCRYAGMTKVAEVSPICDVSRGAS